MLKQVDPFGEGMRACLDAITREACPYAPGSHERQEWFAGWDHSACAIRQFEGKAPGRKYEIRGTDEDGDTWVFATDDRDRAEEVLADMRSDLRDVEMNEKP